MRKDGLIVHAKCIARVGLEGQGMAEYLLSGTRKVGPMNYILHKQNTRMEDARVRP